MSQAEDSPPPQLPEPSPARLLLNAVGANDLPAVKRIIASFSPVTFSESINATTTSWDTPVIRAAQAVQRLPILRHLLAQPHVDVNARSTLGRTALYFASRMNNHEAVQALLNAGANPELGDIFGMTPLKCAAENGHVIVCDLLLRVGKADVNASGEHSAYTPLMLAAAGNHEMVTILLLTYGVQVNASSPARGSALVWACRRGHQGIVRTLVQAGADPRASSQDGKTAFRWANDNGHERCSRFLRQGLRTSWFPSEGNTFDFLKAAHQITHDIYGYEALAAQGVPMCRSIIAMVRKTQKVVRELSQLSLDFCREMRLADYHWRLIYTEIVLSYADEVDIVRTQMDKVLGEFHDQLFDLHRYFEWRVLNLRRDRERMFEEHRKQQENPEIMSPLSAATIVPSAVPSDDEHMLDEVVKPKHVSIPPPIIEVSAV
jgi:hypothetical protein